MTRERDVSTGRLARLKGMARVGARTAIAVMGRRDGEDAAEHAVALLGELRGLAAKVGQMASYVDGFIPDKQRQAYARALSSLQAQTRHSTFPKVQAVIESELGTPLDACFAKFERVPIASASVGQVHLARLFDGTNVAVKVQHPGIDVAMENDLKSGALVARLASLGPKAMNAREIFAQLAARFREELDYRHEARQQTTFRALHRDEPRIHIPRVIDSHSTKRVLTSEFVQAMSLERAVRCTPELRRCFAEVLWRFVFGSILLGAAFNADPHPGNYLFHEDGRVTFLDFGCVQHLTNEYHLATTAMHVAALRGDEPSFLTAARSAFGTRQGSFEAQLARHLWSTFEPIRTSPFHVRPSYVSDLVRQITELKTQMFDASASTTPIPPEVVLLNRLQFGFYSVLARLDIAADYARIDHEILTAAAVLHARTV